jgi:hypothetical protein
MKYLRWTACILLILVASCGGSKTDPTVKRDFIRYQAQLAKVAPLETEAINDHKKISDDPSINDASYARFLGTTFIPKLERYYAEIARIHPTTDALIGLHRLYLKRTALWIVGFKELERAGRTGNQDAIAISREKSAESNAYLKKWTTQMSTLEKRYGD